VRSVSDIRQTEVRTAESVISDPSPSKFKIAITKSKKYKSPSSDEILAELIQAGGEILLS
jgi:hypothetical protein